MLLVFLSVVGVVAGVVDAPELPPSVVKFISNERVNVYTVGPDNLAVVTGFVLGDGVVKDVKEGGISNPTINIYMNNRISKHLEEADDPLGVLKDALDSGEMKIQGVGVKGGIKVSGFLEALKRLAPEGRETPPREISPVASVKDSIETVGTKTDQGTYVIDKTVGLMHSSVEVGATEEALNRMIIIKEYSGLGYNQVPQGTKSLAFSGKEEPVGKFVDLQTPEGVDWAVITFTYTDEELYSKNIKEDELKIKWYDENTGFWVTLEAGNPLWVDNNDWDREKNLIWVNVSHHSVYGIGGSIGPPYVPEKIVVKASAAPAVLGTPSAQQAEFVEVSTESPNWLLRLSVFIILLILVLVWVFIIRRRGKKEVEEEPEESPEEELKEDEEIE
ncbi:MAG: hypothetical protein ACE5HH_03285 [Candidatus Hydrothermarchaeales archaeon]